MIRPIKITIRSRYSIVFDGWHRNKAFIWFKIRISRESINLLENNQSAKLFYFIYFVIKTFTIPIYANLNFVT